MSFGSTPFGTLPSKIVPDFLTIHHVIQIAQHSKDRRPTQWQGSDEYHKRNGHADSRICVEPATVAGQPNHQRRDDHAQIVHCIADDVNKYAHHTEVVAIFLWLMLSVAVVFVWR